MQKIVFVLSLFFFTSLIQAQFNNLGLVNVKENTIVGVFENFDNKTNAKITNNGIVFFHKNFNNDGDCDFLLNSNKGYTIFQSNDSQVISGSGNTKFNQLSVENIFNSPAIFLEKEISVYSFSNFDDGVINNTDGKIIFKYNSASLNENNISFVHGKVYNQGNDNFIYPIGDEKDGLYLYRYVSTGILNDTSTEYSAEYVWNNPDELFSHNLKTPDISNINDNGYWIIKKHNSDFNTTITLSWHPITTPSFLTENLDKLIIVRWNGKKWVNEGGTVDIENNTITTKPQDFGYFTLALKDVSLTGYPNSFSPNGDGKNDLFEFVGLADDFPNFILKIYNRYGNIVYDYKNNGKKNPIWWDGKSKGRLNAGEDTTVPAATYWYVLDFNDGKTKPIQSWLYLNK